MRCNQVSIFIERFGDYVPKDYPADVQRISVYCDDGQSIYAALSKAYACAVNELNEYDHIGARCDVRTNEFSYADYRKMHSTLPIEKRAYNQDYDFQYSDSAKVLYEDYVWMYEHRSEIIDVISQCEAEEDFSPSLKEKFGLNDIQIRKLSQIRLDMLTRERYEDAKLALQRTAAASDNRNRTESGMTIEQTEWMRVHIREFKREIAMLEAYLKAGENYKEIVEIIMDSVDDKDFYDKMKAAFSFTREQSRFIRYSSADNFSKDAREKRTEKLEYYKDILKKYENDLRKYEQKLSEQLE